MRSIKTGLLGFLVSGALGTLLVFGCSASGDSLDPATITDPTQQDDSGGGILPPSTTPDEDDPKPGNDAGKKDASSDASKDAAKDTGPAAPETGDPCPTIDAKITRACGKCGIQEALCRDDGAGKGIVSDYSLCKNETGVCEAGASQACGNCGTQTCSNSCKWNTCTGQPAGSCSPGTTQFDTVSCTQPNTYVQRSCKDTCAWNSYSATCSPPPPFVNVAANVGGVNTTLAILDGANTTPRIPSVTTCPFTAAFLAYSTATTYVEVRNTNPKAVTVTIYNSLAPGGGALKTVMAAYDTIPTTDAARKSCKAVTYLGNSTLTGNSAFASLDGTRQVTIAANSSVQVYVAAGNQTPTTTTPTTGPVALNVRTESIAP